MADSSVFTTDLGAVTAYADAKAHGYTGTREEFGTLLANAGTNLAEANAAKLPHRPVLRRQTRARMLRRHLPRLRLRLSVLHSTV